MEKLKEIPINQIEVLSNCRIRIEDADLTSLISDIKHRGLLQPIGVMEMEKEGYILRFGQRRLEACKKLGWKSISCIVLEKEFSENQFISDNLAENLERKQITPIELGRVCENFYKKNYSVGEIAAILNVPALRVRSAMRILRGAPKEFKEKIQYIPAGVAKNKRGKISASVANAILTLRVPKKQVEELFNVAKGQDLSTSQIRLIGALLLRGMNLKEALKFQDMYFMGRVDVPINKEVHKQYSKKYKTIKGLLFAIIKGEEKPNPDLIF